MSDVGFSARDYLECSRKKSIRLYELATEVRKERLETNVKIVTEIIKKVYGG